MSVGDRLREERLRLGLSQPAFAALAGASKSGQAKWERDGASPNAAALIAFAEAGADVLYILTGRRTADRPDMPVAQIEDQLAGIRRDLLEPTRHRQPGETDTQTEKRVLEWQANALSAMLLYDYSFLTEEMREEIEQLLAAATSPATLSLYRAADHMQNRAKRREMKERLAAWLDGGPYVPGDAVMNLLAALALDYAVPVKLLVELVQELHDDYARRNPPDPRNLGKMEPQR